MDIIPYLHIMIQHSRSMNHIVITNLNTTNAHYMRVDPVPITNSYIMSNYCIGLNKVVISNLRIGSDGGESSHHISYSHFYI